jgi:pimeloyl-ACP methyl ester carboxylesterase
MREAVMTANVRRSGVGPATSDDARQREYRRAEAMLWSHYALEPRERFVTTESPRARLRVVEVGSGDPVLFVHGTGGTGAYWGALVRELRDFRCLLLDRPGWGLSSAIDYSHDDYGNLAAGLLKDVLDRLGIERVHIVGASIGDVWALRLAQRFPSRVGAVGLLGGGPLLQDVAVPNIIRLIRSPIGRVMVKLPDKPGRLRSILRSIGHGPSLDEGRIPEEYIDWRVALSNHTDSMRHERDMVRAIVSHEGFEPTLTFDAAELASIPHPTCMVVGTKDSTAPVEVWERFTGLLPHAELHLVDGGHLPWLDDPVQVATLLSGVFRSKAHSAS